MLYLSSYDVEAFGFARRVVPVVKARVLCDLRRSVCNVEGTRI